MKSKIQTFVLNYHFYFLFTVRHLTKVTFVYSASDIEINTIQSNVLSFANFRPGYVLKM